MPPLDSADFSPPTVPTAWLPVVVLPDGLRLYPVWVLGLAGAVASGFMVAAFAPVVILVGVIPFMPGLATTAWSGNVNSLITVAILAIWWGLRTDRHWPMQIAGGLAAVMTGLKLGPVMIALWVFVQRRTRATAALIASGVVVLAATIAIAGIDSWLRYYDIVRASARFPTELSVPGMLVAAGIPASIATTVALPTVLAAAVILIIVLRKQPLGFLVAVVGSIFATSVVRYETIAIWIVAGAAWLGRGALLRPPPDLGTTLTVRKTTTTTVRLSVVAGTLVAAVAVVYSVATGGLDRSSLRWTTGLIAPRSSDLT